MRAAERFRVPVSQGPEPRLVLVAKFKIDTITQTISKKINLFLFFVTFFSAIHFGEYVIKLYMHIETGIMIIMIGKV